MTTEGKPPGAGKSSFDLVEADRIFGSLRLGGTTVFLDLGCGRGDYTLAAAESIGPAGRVYGIDAWQDGLKELEERAGRLGLTNISTILADLNRAIPLEDHIADVCFMATVLHDLLRENTGEVVLREIARVLKPGGKFAIVEFRKVEEGPGPPVSIRLSADEVEELVRPFGFRREQVSDVGPYHYLFLASLSG